MKRSNTLLCVLLIGFNAAQLKAQLVTPCPTVNCGSLNVGFDTDGSTVFFEGETITLTNLSDAGFEFFIVDWQDGEVDTVMNYDPISHTYDNIIEDPCSLGESFQVRFQALLYCGDVYSCASGGYDFTLVPDPFADFNADMEVCVNEPVFFNNTSCNATEYLWDFGGQGTSIEEDPTFVFTQPGTYSVRLTATGFCGDDIQLMNVNVVAEPNADFNLAGQSQTICRGESVLFDANTNQYTNRNWSITPGPGADSTIWCFTDTTTMNNGTDIINVRFKQTGTYTVRLTGSNACGDAEEEVTIIVEEAPTVSISDPSAACDMTTITPADLGFSISGSFSAVNWSFINGSISSFNGEDFGSVTFNQSGSISVTISGSCGEIVRMVDVVIETLETPLITAPPSLCSGDTLTSLSATPAGGSWTGSGISSDGVLNPAQATIGNNEYTYSLTTGVCSSSSSVTIEIIESATVSLSAPPAACEMVVLNPSDIGFNLNGSFNNVDWVFTNGSPGSFSGEDFGNVTFNQSGTIMVTVASSCGDIVRMIDVEVQTQEVPTIIAPDSLCSGDLPITLMANPPGGSWSGSGISSAGVLNPASAAIGSNTYTYNLSAGACSSSNSVTIELIESAMLNLSTPAAACDLLTLTPADLDFNLSGSYSSVDWEFVNGNPGSYSGEDFGSVTFNQSGTINLVVMSDCGELSRTIDITVQSSEAPALSAPDSICTGSDPINLGALPTGGNWTGSGISSNGEIDPSLADVGLNTYTYTISSGVCTSTASVDIEIVPSATVSVQNDVVCEMGAAIQLIANPTGGIWSGTNVTAAGSFDPVGLPAGYYLADYNFQDANGCMIAQTARVQISALPVLSLTDTAIACLVNESIELVDLTSITADSSGGTYSWVVNDETLIISSINPQLNLGFAGQYPIEVTYEYGVCTAQATATLEIIDNPDLSLSPQDAVCIDVGSLQLTANLGPGTWSGPGIDPNNGLIDLAAAGPGEWDYSFTFAAGSSCAQTEVQTVTIEDPTEGLSAGGPQQLCEGSATTLQLTGGSPIGGLWSGPGIIDPVAGIVDLSLLIAGQNFIYSYTFESPNSNNCNASADKIFTYDRRPDPTYQIDGSLCINETFSLLPTENCDNNFSWNFGDNSPLSSSCNPTYTYSSGGTFTQTMTVTTPQGCMADTSQEINVTTPPTPAFDLTLREGCVPFELQLTDNSSGTDFSRLWCIGTDTINGVAPNGYIIDSILVDTWITIQLKTTNFCGTRSFTDSVLVHPLPRAIVGLELDDGCSPFSPEIINVTLGQPDSFYWDMGNGLTGTDSLPPQVEYTTSADSISIYTLTLEAYNECGVDISTQEITVYPPDVTAFIGLDTIAACQPWAFSPQSFSTAGALLAWEIYGPAGDLVAIGDGPSPSFNLTEAGVHTVLLSAARCGADMDTAYVEVLPAPTVGFTNDLQHCLGTEVSFINSSQAIAGGVWNFGDGETSTDLNPVHIYDSTGMFTVSFTAYSQINACPATAVGELDILALPQVDLSPSDTAACSPLTIDFFTSSSGQEPLVYNWNFGDGSNTSDLQNPSHQYQNTGEYQVSLEVTDGNGCQNQALFNNIRIHPDPVSSFDLIDESLCTRYDSLQAINNSMGSSSSFWILGGETIVGPLPAIAQNIPGVFNLGLVAENEFGCRDTSNQSYEVLASPLAAIEVDSPAVCLDAPISLLSTAINADALLWDLGDQTGSTAMSIEHIYSTAGNYEISLIAISENGCPADTSYLNVRIQPLPTALYTALVPEECGTPAEVQTTNQSQGALSYLWDFGDGRISTQASPIIEYSVAGTYALQLTATTDFGCQDVFSTELNIKGNPVAAFDPPPALACGPYRLQLTAESTEANFYEWYLNDDFAPTIGQQLDTLLDSLGAYDIRLIAIFDDNCRDTLTLFDALEIEATPIADFDYVVDELPNILGDVRFINLSQLATNYFWDFGDGNSSMAFSPAHNYETNIDRPVQLIASVRYPGGLVCRDTIERMVRPEWLTTFFVPTGMAPESIGQEYALFGAKGVGVAEYSLRVFSPYGQLVFETSELDGDRPSGRWDGTLPGSGQLVLQGAYTWIARGRYVNGNPIELEGTVTVIR